MAGGMDLGTGGKGKKRPLDTAINLVPFIDLMAVTICFLIMTAVWTQVGRLQVAQAGGEAAEESDEQTVPITLVVTDKELRLAAGPSQFDAIPVVRDGANRIDLRRLIQNIEEVKAQLPEASSITLQTADAVRYDDLVRIIDECVGAGLSNVSVAAAG